MATKKKMLEAAAGSAGGDPLDITDVFSTYLYAGTNQEITVTNSIDLATAGGMTWIKSRTNTGLQFLFDSERGFSTDLGYPSYYGISSNNTSAQARLGYGFTGMNSDGFRVGYNNGAGTNAVDSNLGASGQTYASWTFRKAPKFFDVVTYTGSDYSGTQNISHNLGSAPGMLVVKKTNGTGSWFVWHRGYGDNGYTYIDSTSAKSTYSALWNDTAPTSTQFSVGVDINTAGATYVAYLFAHNDGDAEFGPTGDQDIIKCGSFTTDSGSLATIDLGFEPSWVMYKKTNSTGQWYIEDTMRGLPAPTAAGNTLIANLSNAEGTGNGAIHINTSGFEAKAAPNNLGASNSFIYMAIRRGPLAPPEAGTEVFATDHRGSSAATAAGTSYYSGFPVDMTFGRNRTYAGANTAVYDRLRGDKNLFTDLTNAEGTASYYLDSNTGFWSSTQSENTAQSAWMWKRAPGYFDVVAYTGNGTAAQTIGHNLGVAPEMMWVKSRSLANDWVVYHSGVAVDAETDYLKLNTTSAKADWVGAWNDTAPTSSSFTVGSTPNTNSATYIAYLFATLAGVSKVGSVTHSGTTNVDCGFSAGARFVLLKRTDATGDWYYWDSVRGIVSGNDPYLLLNSTAAEVTSTDYIDPLSSGFTITSTFTAGDYIFYAIA